MELFFFNTADKVYLNNGSSITADKIDFGTGSYFGTLNMNGGTLTTNLNQIFDSVTATTTIDALDPYGNTVTVPMDGLTDVGSVKEAISTYLKYDSGNFNFTDNGWTQNVVSSAVSSLGAAFGSGISNTNVTFSGTKDTVSFDVAFIKSINNNTNALIFTNEVLDASGYEATGLTFGSSGINGNYGFAGIDTVGKVTVDDTRSLYLLGSTQGDYATTKLLTGSNDGGTVDVSNGMLFLGMQNGPSDRHGMVSTVKGNVTALSGEYLVKTLQLPYLKTATVRDGAVLHVGEVTASTDGTLVVEKGGTLKLENTGETAVRELNNAGTTEALGELRVSHSFGNRDQAVLTGTSLVTESSAYNNGTIRLSGTLKAEGFTNSGKLEAASTTIARLYNNGGTLGTNNLKLQGLSQQGGTISVTGDLSCASSNTDSLFDVKGGTLTAENILLTTNVPGTTRKTTLRVGTDAVVTANNEIKTDVIDTTGTVTAKQATVTDVTIKGGTLKAEALSFEKLTNGGRFEYTGDGAFTVGKSATLMNEATGTIQGLKVFAVEGEVTNKGKITGDGAFTVEKSATLTNEATGTIQGLKVLTVNGNVANSGVIDVSETTTLGQSGNLTQTENAVLRTGKLSVQGSQFDGIGGTLIMGELSFEGNGPATVNFAQNQKEMVVRQAKLDGGKGLTYNVGSDKILTFGTEGGLVGKLADLDPSLTVNNGALVAGQSVTIGKNGTVNVGTGSSGGATANLNVTSDSLTVVDASALTDGTAFTGTGGATARIEQGAKVVVTRVTRDGDLTLLKGFDLDSVTVDGNGNWTGGWTGDDAIYVNDGSGLDYVVSTSLNADRAFVARIEMPDVSTVYPDLAIADIANAALRRGQTGGDVTLIQKVIRNDRLSVSEKTNILNSIAQMGTALGTSANFLADTTRLIETVEERAAGIEAIDDATTGSGLWVKAEGGMSRQDGLELAGNMKADYDVHTRGLTLGADTPVMIGGADLRLGAAFSYLDGRVDADGGAIDGENRYQTFGLQGYAMYNISDTFRVIGTLDWFRSWNDMTQKVKRAGAAGISKAEGEVTNDAYTMSLRAQKAFDISGFSVTPYAGLRAIYMLNGDYTVKIDGESAFRNTQKDTLTFQTPVGIKAAKTFETESGWTIAPSVNLAVIPQFGDTKYDTTVTGVGTGVAQTLNAEMAGNILGQAKVGLTATCGNADFTLSYGLTVGDAGREGHALTVGISYAF